jgi:hypothetical protein
VQPCELVRRESLPRLEARSRAPGLHLDQDQPRAIREQEVDLAPAGEQAPREQALALPGQEASCQALAGQGEGGIARQRQRQAQARTGERQELEPEGARGA